MNFKPVLFLKCRNLCTVFAFFFAFSASAAQNTSQQTGLRTSEGATANLPSQVIGPNDLIGLSVYDSPEFSRTVRVGPDGTIRLPMVKKKIQAAGLLPGDLETSVAKVLVDERLLVDPFVTITISEYQSRPIIVVGAVKTPVTFQASGPVNLIDAVTRAGGVTEDAEGELLVSRCENGKASAVRRISIRALIDAGDPALNITLIGGEEIRVPVAPRITVAGNVKKPGSYPVKEDSEMTVMKAIAMAEGTAQFWGDKAYIYRDDASTGKKREIEVPLAQILKRKASDVPLVPRDILYVTDSTGKRNLEKAIAIAGATGSGLLIFR